METIFTLAVIGYIVYKFFKWIGKDKGNGGESDIQSIKKESDQIDVNVDDKLKEVAKNTEHNLVKRINFVAVGTKYKKAGNKTGQDILKAIVNRMRREEYFYEKYEGMTNKEIEEESFGERVYELNVESIPVCALEFENDNEFDPNAIKVMVGFNEGELHHMGYVPREHCEEIRSMMEQYRILVGNTIYGGKYKYADYDEYGEYKVLTDSTPYGLRLSVSFWDD